MGLKRPKITKADMPEYDRIVKAMREALEESGGYSPAFDDPYIEQAAKAIIYSRKIEAFLDRPEELTPRDLAALAEAKNKFRLMLDKALERLMARRDSEASAKAEGELRKLAERLMGLG